MENVNYDYLRYPKGSKGQVLGRRKEAHDLAKRMMLEDKLNRDNIGNAVKDEYYRCAYMMISIEEACEISKGSRWM